ncbi:hypothetical protein BDP55DRAFT_703261 [Colletotrichum godetiae]|uniref:Zn(2)-C6 fungal-type domain-containing protein n=1 Tax=Colletotrichum godetiae TaxID=1209918 RepID=A0AAJ0ANI0_9PEZI|nr:uncharacterized protein BDP55DRAFT_703261 [Colletotrichum godetiae]KAK1687449.1 hypothetical protein BDP55DRAFT_703261 [Colletotrichum godetiae]
MQRARGGCMSCRRRKRKCDRRRPFCEACTQRGIQCPGYSTPLRWVDGATNHPAVGEGSSSTGTPTELDSISSQVALPSRPSPHVQTTHVTDDLFHKFLRTGLMGLYSTSVCSWVQPFFVEMSAKSKSLVLLSSAIQAYLDEGSSDMSVSSMEYIDTALKEFRREIVVHYDVLPAATACSGVLLCVLQFLQAQPCTPVIGLLAESFHLNTSMAYLKPNPEHDLSVRHALEFIGLMDMPCLVLGRQCPSMGIWRRFRKVQDSWKGGRVGGLEVVTGVPQSLLDIFSDTPFETAEVSISRFWGWPGEMGEYVQCLLWDCWRFAGLLHIRRREQRRNAARKDAQFVGDDQQDVSPSSEIVLYRLVSGLHLFDVACQLSENQHLLCRNGIVFPLITACLETRLLKRHSDWKQTVDEVRAAAEKRYLFQLARATWEVLDEAWKDGTMEFDVDAAIARKGQEVSLL